MKEQTDFFVERITVGSVFVFDFVSVSNNSA